MTQVPTDRDIDPRVPGLLDPFPLNTTVIVVGHGAGTVRGRSIVAGRGLQYRVRLDNGDRIDWFGSDRVFPAGAR